MIWRRKSSRVIEAAHFIWRCVFPCWHGALAFVHLLRVARTRREGRVSSRVVRASSNIERIEIAEWKRSTRKSWSNCAIGVSSPYTINQLVPNGVISWKTWTFFNCNGKRRTRRRICVWVPHWSRVVLWQKALPTVYFIFVQRKIKSACRQTRKQKQNSWSWSWSAVRYCPNNSARVVNYRCRRSFTIGNGVCFCFSCRR